MLRWQPSYGHCGVLARRTVHFEDSPSWNSLPSLISRYSLSGEYLCNLRLHGLMISTSRNGLSDKIVKKVASSFFETSQDAMHIASCIEDELWWWILVFHIQYERERGCRYRKVDDGKVGHVYIENGEQDIDVGREKANDHCRYKGEVNPIPNLCLDSMWHD